MVVLDVRFLPFRFYAIGERIYTADGGIRYSVNFHFVRSARGISKARHPVGSSSVNSQAQPQSFCAHEVGSRHFQQTLGSVLGTATTSLQHKRELSLLPPLEGNVGIDNTS